MIWQRTVVIIALLYLANVILALESPEASSDSSKENVSITKWQYCLSCKETVNLYVRLAADEIKNMQKTGKPAMTSLEANQLAHYICDHSTFDHFQPWMKYGCMKLMEDNYLDFLQQFAGHVSANDIINKADNYKRKRRICGKHAKACHPSEFKKSNVTKSERTKCNACRLIANDVENIQKQYKKAATFKEYLSEEYCKQIGYSFHPYLWMEEICEEMVDDHLKDIIDILNLQAGIRRTGLAPTESTDDMMCKEFYNCKKKSDSQSQTDDSSDDFEQEEL